jgi:O-antigen/teichoic acid export membrane protein
MSPRSRLLIFMTIMFLLLAGMALIVVHLAIRPPRHLLVPLDVMLIAFMSLPFVGHAMNAGQRPSASRRMVALASPLALGTFVGGGILLDQTVWGVILGLAGFAAITAYYYLGPRQRCN